MENSVNRKEEMNVSDIQKKIRESVMKDPRVTKMIEYKHCHSRRSGSGYSGVSEDCYYSSEWKFNEFYEKYIMGNKNFSIEELKEYIEPRKMTEQGRRDWKLWLLKHMARGVE